jgi:hypothetical protein
VPRAPAARKSRGARKRGGDAAAERLPPAAAPGAEAALFRLLNGFLEPVIRSGYAFPPLAPGGLLVLETRGRTSGRRYRVPLAAMRLGRFVLIGTFRGARSHWPRNLAADRAPRLWLGGRARPVRAQVFARRVPPSRRALPPELRWLPALLAPYLLGGWAFALLSFPARNGGSTRPL